MKSWAEKTYWFKLENGGLQAAVIDDDGIPFDEFGDSLDLGFTTTPATQFEPCKDCTFLGDCMSSQWNELTRIGGPENPLCVSGVGTCKTCGKHTLSFWARGPLREVPKECPRWDKLQGSALDCDSCRVEKDDLQRAHPDYEEYSKALEALSGKLNMLAGRRGGKSLMQAGALYNVLNLHVKEYEPERLVKAQAVLGVLVPDIRRRFSQEMLGLNAELLSMMGAGWLDVLYVSLLRNPENHEKVAHEFVLVFNDKEPFAMAWAKETVATRKLIERVWGGLIRKVIQA